MFDMMKMMGKVKEVQEKMKLAQEELQHIFAEGESGGGLVKATANGKKELVKLEIDPSLFDEKEIISDLIIAATNIAMKNAEEKAKAHLQEVTQGMIPNIPGLDLNNMV